MSSTAKTDQPGKIAVIGERELVIGYRLLGIDETFIVSSKEQAYKTMESLLASHKYALIIASHSVREALPSVLKAKVDSSLEPLVLFMPSLKGNVEEESIASLAKRVLGINIKMS
ncbi:MAG: V-type ATP synthase subunit F [Nitrososphaera sp.]|jgi:V/A-type H+-transporting ATPase subunit F